VSPASCVTHAQPKLDGAYSVSGPCGGVSAYAAQGVTTVTSGSVVSLKIGYNGGHQDQNNAFHASYVCGTYAAGSTFDDSVLKLATQPATLASPRLLPLTDGSALVPAADSLTSGYTLTFKAPTLPAGSTAQDCVISLLDQRNWGGWSVDTSSNFIESTKWVHRVSTKRVLIEFSCCLTPSFSPASSVDIKLVPGGTGQTPGSSTTLGVRKSPCSTYCDMMKVNCVGQYVQYPAPATGASCMTTCGNMTVVDEKPGEGVWSGDNLQCRQHHVEAVAAQSDPSLHCPHAGAASTADACMNGLTDPPRAQSPCSKYCTAIEEKCAANKYYTDRNECLAKCAGFLVTGLGQCEHDSDSPVQSNVVRAAILISLPSSLSPTGADQSKGNNTQCRLASALAGSCADANPESTGECGTANPLKLEADTISAVYATQAGQCDTPTNAAANTISGCCCLTGTITVIHVKGSTLATVTSNLTTTNGAMCGSGFMSIPNGADPTKPPANYTFDSPVAVTPLKFNLAQSDAASTDLQGSFTIGGDPFDFQLVDGLLVITNNVPSTRAPRVCSIQAKAVSKIDTSGMTPDAPGGDLGAATTGAQWSPFGLLAALAVTLLLLK
jgi:hypothetical protein